MANNGLRQARAALAAWPRDYNRIGRHSALRRRPTASIMQRPCSHSSTRLRARFARALRLVVTLAGRPCHVEDDREGETASLLAEERNLVTMNGTVNQGPNFRTGVSWSSGRELQA